MTDCTYVDNIMLKASTVWWQVEAQVGLINRAETDLQNLADERRQLTARAAQLAAQEENLKQREADLVRKEAEITTEAARYAICMDAHPVLCNALMQYWMVCSQSERVAYCCCIICSFQLDCTRLCVMTCSSLLSVLLQGIV